MSKRLSPTDTTPPVETADPDVARLARRTAQFFTLNAVAEAITESSEVVPMLNRVLDVVMQVMRLGAGAVHLLDVEEDALLLAAHRNLQSRATELLARFELGEGVIGQTAVIGETLIVTDTQRDTRIARPHISAEGIGALASVPLVARGGEGVAQNVRGVLTLFHDAAREFTEHECGMLAAIGRQVGVALEQKRLFDEVTAAHREWEQTFEAMTDGVSVHAPSGRIRRANRSLAELFGTSPAALIGVRCCTLYHDSPRPRPDCTIMRTVTERAGQVVELSDRLRGRVLRVTTDPVINREGRVTGVVCTTRDITEEKLIERRLVQQERISAIGELAAGIAHEVGTPLQIISANVEYLLRDHTAQHANESGDELQAIREQAHNITRLVRQLLDFARDHSPTIAPVNLNELITRTIQLLAHTLDQAGVRTELQLAPYIPTIDGDAAQLQQVFFNIITNARQSMMQTHRGMESEAPVSGGTLHITTDSALTDTEEFSRPHVVITIGDTGAGIPAEALPHVFKPFFTANKEGGTGLGLAISTRIIQRHNGLLSIESNYPHGTLVRLRLPLSQN